MKPEPLKDKIKNRMGCIYFNGKDIKSAVEGLKQDISDNIQKWEQKMEEYVKDLDFANEAYAGGQITSLRLAKNLIDKWFEDVI